MKLNSKGFTLVETIIGAAVLAGILLTAATLFRNFYTQTLQVERLKDLNLSFFKTRAQLSSFNSCTRTLGPFAPTFASNPMIPEILDHQGASLYRAGAIVAPEVQLVSMQLRLLTTTAIQTGGGFERVAILQFNYQIVGPAFNFFNYQVSKFIPMSLQYQSATGPFVGCFTTGSIGTDDEYLNEQRDDMQTFQHKRDMLTLNGRLVILTSTVDPANSGFLIAQGYLATSDMRLKSNIQTIPSPLQTIQKLQVYEYDKNNSGMREIGFLAQDLENKTPIVETQNNGYKSVNYSSLVGLSVEGAKELHKKQSSLENRIQKLRNNIKALKIDLTSSANNTTKR